MLNLLLFLNFVYLAAIFTAFFPALQYARANKLTRAPVFTIFGLALALALWNLCAVFFA